MRMMPRRLGPTCITYSTYHSFVSFSFEGPSLAARFLIKTCRPRLNIRLSATSSDIDHGRWRHFLLLLEETGRITRNRSSSLRARHNSILTLLGPHALLHVLHKSG